MGQPRWFRLLRAAAFAVVCVLLSVAGHDVMAARPAPVWAGGLALVLVTVLGYLLAGRRRSALGILLAVEAVQACLHALFSWATPAIPITPANAMPGGMTMVMGHGMPAGMAGPGMAGPDLFAVHALAGVLVAGWLYAGERAAWWALAVVVKVVLRPVRQAFAVLSGSGGGPWCRPRVRRRARSGGRAPRAVVALRHVVVRRGPPAAGGVTAPVLP